MGGGGGGGSPAYQPVQQQDVQIEPVPQTQLQTEGYGGMGYTQVPQTFTPEAAPSWMQGGTMDLAGQGYQGMPSMEQYGMNGKASPNWYQMPSWGKDAVTGEALTQEQLQPAAYQPPEQQEAQPEAQQESPQQDENQRWMDYQRDRDIYRNTQARLGSGTDDYNEVAVWSQYGGPWSAASARDKFRSSNEYKYKPKSQWTMLDAQNAARRR